MPERPTASEIVRRTLTLALPVLGEQFLWMLLGWSDLYLAKTIGPEPKHAMAAIGMGSQVMWILQVVFATVAVGATAIVARSIGAGDRHMASRATRQAMVIGPFMALAAAAAIFTFARPMLSVLGLAGQALDNAVLFVRILVPGMVVGVLEIIGAACLRGAGNTRAALMIVGVANVINIALAWTLRWGWFGLPPMGLAGIAIGTSVSFAFGGLLTLWLLSRGYAGLRVRLAPLHFDWPLTWRMLRIGVFSGLEGVMIVGAATMVAAIVTRLDDTTQYAAYIATLRLESASFLPGIAFAVAGGALVGQCLGAGRPEQAVRFGRWTYFLGGGLMTVMGLTFIAFPAAWSAIFTSTDPQVAAYSQRMLRICGFTQPWLAAILIFSGLLKGAGDTRYPLIITLVGALGFRLPGAWLVAHVLGYDVVAVWLVLCVDLFVRGTLTAIRFFCGGWKTVKV